MSLRIRFTLLILALFGALLLAVALLQEAERREHKLAVSAAQAEAQQSWIHLIKLSDEAFNRFVRGYSWWDDMSAFMISRDPAWADTQLNRALHFHELSAIWVIDPSGRPVYQVNAPDGMPSAVLPAPADLLQIAHKEPFANWFKVTSAGLVELRMAPIQPSADRKRTSEPRGWLVAARPWDGRQLARLTSIFGGSATLVDPGSQPEPTERAVIQVYYPLRDAAGEIIAQLRIARTSPSLEIYTETDSTEAMIFIGFSIAILAVVIFALQRWILLPLATINTTLRTRETQDLQRLRYRPDEVGSIPQEVSNSFTREQELQREITHRQKITESLRQVIDERILLGRNLHDSVIQTIYASGLNLAATRNLLHTEPAEAERKLAQIHFNLNETIRELRTYITGLEPESITPMSFQETVQNVVDALEPPAGWVTTLDIDENIIERLSRDSRVQMLQILRESLSNAIRHGQADSIEITVAATKAEAVMSIVDNGVGFVPFEPNLKGNGLNNMKARALDLGGKLDIFSEPGDGTTLLLSLPLIPSIS